MVYLTFIIAVIALIIAILAYQKVGGLAELKKQIDQIASSAELKKSIESMAAATESLREKTAGAIGRLETTLKKVREEKKAAPPPKKSPRKRTTKTKEAEVESTEEPS